MTMNMTHVKPKAEFNETSQKHQSETHFKRKITQNQYERLMQLRRSR